MSNVDSLFLGAGANQSFKGRREPFKELKELETQIQTVWEAASNQDKLHNSFQGSWLL